MISPPREVIPSESIQSSPALVEETHFKGDSEVIDLQVASVNVQSMHVGKRGSRNIGMLQTGKASFLASQFQDEHLLIIGIQECRTGGPQCFVQDGFVRCIWGLLQRQPWVRGVGGSELVS